jgi:hypothetical protein
MQVVSTALLAACFMLDCCLAYYSTLKMDEIYSYEMLVDFQRTTKHYTSIPQNKSISLSLLTVRRVVSLFRDIRAGLGQLC